MLWTTRAVRWVVGLAVVAGVWTALVPVGAQAGYTPEWGWGNCPFLIPQGETEGETLSCGYLYVPQDRANPDGPWIELAVALLYSTGDNPAADPILYLEGGPGGSALSGIDAWLESPFREERDIILFDQRGTGYSLPRLHCWEVSELRAEASADDEMLAAHQACLERLEGGEGVELDDYNSAASAADVSDLREVLGVDAWNLYGVSYGTRLALTVMRDVPEGVRSVILDSTYPLHVDAYEEQALNFYRALQVMFANCEAEPACSAAYPDLETRFLALVDWLNATPLEVPELEASYTGADVAAEVFQWFYSGEIVPYVPRMIAELERGETETFVALTEGTLPETEEQVTVDDSDPELLFVDELWALADSFFDDDDVTGFLDELSNMDPITYDGMVTAIYNTFTEDDAAYLAALLDDIDEDEIARVLFALLADDVSDTDGLYNAVECREEVPFNSYEEAEALAAEVPEQIAWSELDNLWWQQRVCDVWLTGTAPAFENEPVFSAIPTLVLAGEYDPITPPDWGWRAAEWLENATFFEFPGVGHGAIDGGDCPEQIGLAFLDNPDVEPDGSCIATMGRPPFALP